MFEFDVHLGNSRITIGPGPSITWCPMCIHGVQSSLLEPYLGEYEEFAKQERLDEAMPSDIRNLNVSITYTYNVPGKNQQQAYVRHNTQAGV